MKIVFFGTSNVGLPILQALHKEHEVVQVATSPDKPVGRKQILTSSPVAQLAEELSLSVTKPEAVKNNPEFIEFLKTLNADIFIVVSYGKILPIELINIPALKTVNVHFSLLPKYRGPSPIQFALLNGESTTGTTIFVLDEKVDNGPILASKELEIQLEDNFLTLAEKLSEVSAELITDVLPKYQSGEIVPQEQNQEEATFTKIIHKEDGLIDWHKTAGEIYNMHRAYTPWPGIWTKTNEGKIFKILECKPAQRESAQAMPCGNQTWLELITVQMEGKKPTSMADFLKGNPNFTAKHSAQ